MSKSLLSAFFLSAIACSSGTAQVITSTSASAPTDAFIRIAAENPASSQRWSLTSNSYVTANTHRDVGQTFVISGESDVQIQSFVFRISSVADPVVTAVQNANFTLTVYEIDGANPFPITTSPLYEQTGTLPGNLEPLDYLSFALDTPVIASAGSHYAVQLTFNSAQSGRSLFFVSADKSTYGNGTMYTYSNTAAGSSVMNYTIANAQLDFGVFATAIPEGQTAMLVAGGLAITGLSRFARRARQGAPR